ncbi:MAG: NAD(P)H-dependent oxidoreductase subunit E [Bacteroidales bacterium]|jgi:NADH-quinone oxidoreductase subunit E|nr:NAD(P)H-dependent oxidoreductase subunit E [Bacteroidales bacterium]
MDQQFINILSEYPAGKKEGLLPILQEIQKERGFLTEDVLADVSLHLNLPINKIYGVAAFYDQFHFHPHGRNHFRICNGTACYLFGSSTFLKELEKQLKVKAGSTSRDGKFSLEIVTCLGSCDQAPVILVNETYYTRVTPGDLNKIIHSLKDKEE